MAFYSIYQKGKKKRVTLANWSTRELAQHQITFFEKATHSKKGSLEVREVPEDPGGGKCGSVTR